MLPLGQLSTGLRRETQRIYTQFPVFDNSPLLRHDNDDFASQCTQHSAQTGWF